MSTQQLFSKFERALGALALGALAIFATTIFVALGAVGCGDVSDESTPSFDDKASAVDSSSGSAYMQSRSDSDFQVVGNGTIHVQVPTRGYTLVKLNKRAGQQVTVRLTNIRGTNNPDIDLLGHWTPQVGWSAAEYWSLNWGTREEIISFRPGYDGPYYPLVPVPWRCRNGGGRRARAAPPRPQSRSKAARAASAPRKRGAVGQDQGRGDDERWCCLERLWETGGYSGVWSP